MLLTEHAARLARHARKGRYPNPFDAKHAMDGHPLRIGQVKVSTAWTYNHGAALCSGSEGAPHKHAMHAWCGCNDKRETARAGKCGTHTSRSFARPGTMWSTMASRATRFSSGSVTAVALPKAITLRELAEWWKPERASTMPSSSVTVTQMSTSPCNDALLLNMSIWQTLQLRGPQPTQASTRNSS